MRLTHRIRRSLSRPFALPLDTPRIAFLRTLREVAVRQAKVSLGLYGPLTSLAAKYKSDKGVTVFPFHGYTVHYERLFAGLRHRTINILEIGLSRTTDRGALKVTCPSLRMWLDYFPVANVYGFDIDDFSSVRLPRTRIFRGDQGNVEDLLKVVAECPPFDVIIDDGSHASYHQQLTLKTLFPYLAGQGVYVIEDLLWQPKDLEALLPAVWKTRELLKNRSALTDTISGVGDVLFFRSPLVAAKEELGVVIKDSTR